MDYKKYSLENLENWMHDALSCSEATPQEIYDVIKRVVDENYHIYKNHTERCYELLALLNGNGKGHIPAYDEYVEKKENLVCDKDDKSPKCQKAWNDFWEENYYPEEYSQYSEEVLNAMCDKAASEKDKVTKWILPVQQIIEEGVDNYFIQLPDDLLEQVNWKNGDQLYWIDRGDGSFEIKKVIKPVGMEEC
jgi:hypothetical protein